MPFFRFAPLVAALLLLPCGRVRAEEPSPAPAPAEGPTEAERAECIRMVEELRDEASRIRGLPWKTPVPADLISRKALRAFMLEEMDEEYPPAERERDLLILRRIGMLNDREDLLEMEMQFLEMGVAGFYDPRKKHLRIIEGFVGDGQRPTILHELTHALEDQYFDLRGRVKPIEEDSDRLFAEKCIEEGAAELARVRYEAAHPELKGVFEKAQNDPKMAAAQAKILPKIPAFMWQATLMQYSHGLKFVQRAVEGGTFAERMAALYKDPPVSQEQILHPSRWFTATRDYPQAVVWAADLAKTAGEGWTLLHEMPSGELDLAFYLDFHLHGLRGRMNLMTGQIPPSPTAKRGAAGWDGCFNAYLRKEGAPLAVVNVMAFDTAKDAWEAAEMLGQAAKKAAGASWAGRDWVKGEAGADGVPATATLEYANSFGVGRLYLDGTHVLNVDGVAVDVLARLWPVVVQTTFVRDARDTWDADAVDPAWAAASYRDEDLGVGVSAPNAAWKAGPGSDNAFARVVHAANGTEVSLIHIAQGMPVDALLPLLIAQLKSSGFPGVASKAAGPALIGEHEGARVVLGERTSDGKFGEMSVASEEDRVWIAIVVGPDAATLETLRPDIGKILASIVVRD